MDSRESENRPPSTPQSGAPTRRWNGHTAGTVILTLALLLLPACGYVEPENTQFTSEIERVASGGMTEIYTLCNHGNRLYVYKAGYAGGIAVVPGACDGK